MRPHGNASLPQQFKSLCPNATDAEATNLLQEAGGDLDLAVALYESTRAPPPARVMSAKDQKGTSARTPGSNNYFVGGGKSSGQAVEAPPQPSHGGKDNSNTLVEDLFAQARERGAQEGVPETSNPAFSGSGRRLGHLEGPSPVMAPVRRTERSVLITFYRNGFQVDDGPLRSLEDADGRRFIETIHRGRVPQEIGALYPNTDIAVTLADRNDEDYVPPKYKAFAGQGRAVEQAPAPASAASSSQKTGSTQPSAAPAVSRRPFVLNPNDETCTVVVQGLANTRVEVKVNPTVHTVDDLLGIAIAALPGTVESSVELCTRGFPTGLQVLTNMQQTVHDAKLRNTVVTLRAKKG